MTDQKTIETPLTIDIRAHSYNPDVRSGRAPITAFDVLQWLRAQTSPYIEPNITADGSIYLIEQVRTQKNSQVGHTLPLLRPATYIAD